MFEFDPARIARARSAVARDPRGLPQALSTTATEIVGVAGAGIVLMADGRAVGTMCVSDHRTEVVEDLQFACAEGPSCDAYRDRRPVVVPDLDAMEPGRWLAFGPGALDVGVRAAFGFPLLVDTVCLGVLDLYHDAPGALADGQMQDAQIMAHLAAEAVLGWQAVGEALEVPWQLEHVPLHRAVVHQASGMISVQASTSVENALALLRAHAFAEGRSVGDLAADVVAGRFRFEG